jgi:hypothetical protein
MHEYNLPYRKIVSFLFVHSTATSTKPREHKKIGCFFFRLFNLLLFFFFVKSNNRFSKVERTLLEVIIISLHFVAKCGIFFLSVWSYDLHLHLQYISNQWIIIILPYKIDKNLPVEWNTEPNLIFLNDFFAFTAI